MKHCWMNYVIHVHTSKKLCIILILRVPEPLHTNGIERALCIAHENQKLQVVQ